MLESHVLVLNRSFHPVHVTTARRALALLYQGVAKAIDRQCEMFDFESWAELGAQFGDDAVRTVRGLIKIPRVIVLVLFDRMPRGRVRFSRANIYARDNDTCQYCGRRLPRVELNLDHVVPRRQGGLTKWENIVCSCILCNLKKGGRTPSEAGMKLRRAPVRPRWTPMYRIPMRGRFSIAEGAMMPKSEANSRARLHWGPYEEWRPFLNFAELSYWNVELDSDPDLL